jgi:pimeloyl-ACP methyl ester carboxylesterase
MSRAQRIVVSDTATLAVNEWGAPAPDRPTVVMAHGWPDSSAVWDLVAERLAERFHVVTYDARGIGRSTPAVVHQPYALRRMADDLDAVVHATSPDRPTHIVGHDWGSVQAWEYVADPDRQPWAASYTSISGPCLDHLGHSMRARLRRPTPRRIAPVLAQAAKSSYVLFLHVPVASTAIWRLGFARLFRRWIERAEGVPAGHGYPAATLAQDAINGIHLYRTNIFRRLRRPQERRTTLPVQLIVATRDHYVTPRLAGDVEQWVPDLVRRDVDAGHWAPRTHPEQIAELIAAHIDAVESRAASRAMVSQ